MIIFYFLLFILLLPVAAFIGFAMGGVIGAIAFVLIPIFLGIMGAKEEQEKNNNNKK